MMINAITQEYVDTLIDNDAEGRLSVELDELKNIYKYARKPSVVVVYLQPNTYIRFDNIPKLEFFLKKNSNKSELSFIEDLTYVNASSQSMGYGKFLLNEFFQGNGWRVIPRFIWSVAPLVLLNILMAHYSTDQNMKDIFTGLLSAISIFVAIFSVFTVGQSYKSNRKLDLFENGKLSHYFSIDHHMTTTGLLGMLFCLFGLVIVAGGSARIIYGDLFSNLQDLLIVIFLNLAFLSAYIVLRSIKEFYIGRPGSYIMADMKDELFTQRIRK